jgi:uncharacterized membrane protein YcgQ (UPF0703/DUF1980 family)
MRYAEVSSMKNMRSVKNMRNERSVRNMKSARKYITIIIFTVCLLLGLASCGNKAPADANSDAVNGNGTKSVNISDADLTAAQTDDSEVFEIREKMFIAQSNDIYFNPEDYLGKTIKYEGIFQEYPVPEENLIYRSVIRYGPGCCGIDANAGFEVIWDKDYPEQDDWVEVVGKLVQYEEYGTKYLRIELSSLTVLEERGLEYVSQ